MTQWHVSLNMDHYLGLIAAHLVQKYSSGSVENKNKTKHTFWTIQTTILCFFFLTLFAQSNVKL